MGALRAGRQGSVWDRPPRLVLPSLAVLAMGACGGRTAGGSDGGSGTDPTGDGGPGQADSHPGIDAGPAPSHDELGTLEGCAGVFNPDQVLDLYLDMAAGDWQTVLSDASYSTYVPAQFRCGDEAPLTVGVRRKRSGGTNKVGLKIDVNEIVAGQTFHGLRKLSLENGVSEGTTSDTADVGTLVSEYLAWRLMSRSGAISGRAAFVRLFVDGEAVGVYVNVEQVDKRFLRAWLADDDGWLYKKSGGVNDGFKTHETDGLNDPYDDYFCFFERNGCPAPSDADLAAELPGRLDIPQMLRVGAVNAYISNTDAPLFKDNNYYWYDGTGGVRTYIPWDLDTAMNDGEMHVLEGGVGGQTAIYTDVLYSNWRADYEAILGELVGSTLSQDVIGTELDRVESAAGAALDGDPYLVGSAGEAVVNLRSWWTNRSATVASQIPE